MGRGEGRECLPAQGDREELWKCGKGCLTKPGSLSRGTEPAWEPHWEELTLTPPPNTLPSRQRMGWGRKERGHRWGKPDVAQPQNLFGGKIWLKLNWIYLSLYMIYCRNTDCLITRYYPGPSWGCYAICTMYIPSYPFKSEKVWILKHVWLHAFHIHDRGNTSFTFRSDSPGIYHYVIWDRDPVLLVPCNETVSPTPLSSPVYTWTYPSSLIHGSIWIFVCWYHTVFNTTASRYIVNTW